MNTLWLAPWGLRWTCWQWIRCWSQRHSAIRFQSSWLRCGCSKQWCSSCGFLSPATSRLSALCIFWFPSAAGSGSPGSSSPALPPTSWPSAIGSAETLYSTRSPGSAGWLSWSARSGLPWVCWIHPHSSTMIRSEPSRWVRGFTWIRLLACSSTDWRFSHCLLAT